MANDISNVVIHTPGRIMHGFRVSEAELREKIKTQRAFNPDVLESNPPVIFPVEISNNNVDSYYTIMAESTLRNFAEDADRGVSVQDSHDTRSLGFGHSLSGRLIEEVVGNELRLRVESEFYTVPGLSVRDGKKSDDYILGLNAGIYRDFSVGFHLGDDGLIRCNICGNNMMEWWGDCTHWPGERYTVPVDPDVPDGPTVEKIALGVVEGARLSEYSPVYDGATPGAGVLKAERMIDAGELDARKARSLEVMYRHRLPNVREYWSLQKENKMVEVLKPTRSQDDPPVDDQVTVEEENEETDDEQVSADLNDNVSQEASSDEPMFELEEEETEEEEAPEEDESRSIDDDSTYYQTERARLEGLGLRIKDNPHRVAIALADKVLELRSKVRTLETEAAWGREYREAMIADALREGVRAQGENFDEEKFEAFLRRDSTTMEDIRLMRDTWSAAGDARFGQGRKTRERSRTVPEPVDNFDEAAFVDQE
jgi:hypothetical protein